jgi:putative ABC transport system substrate-binding protein
MKRREFITLIGGVAASPIVVRAQQHERMRRIGVLMPMTENDSDAAPRISLFVKSLEELGWQDGKNIRFDYRWGAASGDRFRVFAAELVELKPDLILVTGLPGLAALRQETRTLPIVFLLVVDPVGIGFVKSLAHPGGNITGITNFEPSMVGKWLEMLKEIAPRVTRILFIFDPDTTPYATFLSGIERFAPSLAIEAIAKPVHNRADIEAAIVSFAEAPNGGVAVMPCPLTLTNREQIVELNNLHRLPAVYPYGYFATSGGLLAYGVDVHFIYRQVSTYLDKILKGENPGDLPVEAPTKFELLINLKTAKALDITVPAALLARADEVIE